MSVNPAAESQRRTRVFVYGTLRRGASNHFRMAGASFVREGFIIGKLYQIDWFPGLILDETGDPIRGEVFEVDPDLLGALDRFEGVAADESESEYRRVPTHVLPVNGEETLTADVWEWLGEVDESKRMKGGDWLEAFGG